MKPTDLRMTTEILTLNALLERHAQTRPDAIFVHHRSGDYSYREFADQVDGFARFLLGCGLGPGSRICTILPRRPEALIAFLAATRIGALPVALNYLLNHGDLLTIIADSAPAVVIASGALLRNWTDDWERVGIRPYRVATDATPTGCTPWDSAVATTGALPALTQSPDDLAYLNQTTGSSGAPKSALASHANLYWNTRAAIDAFALTEDDVHLCMFAAFAHPHELFCRALLTGGSLALLEEINPKSIAQTIKRHSVTCMMGLAPMFRMIAGYCEASAFDSLRLAESGGMYTNPETHADFFKRIGVPIMSVWGSTETSGIALANTTDGYRLDGSMGRVCPHYDAQLIDDSGRTVADGTIGELAIRGPAVISGYAGGHSMERSGDWYRTGDLARRDRDGFYYYIDRISGMIKVAGLKVYPLQIELVLSEHPGVRDVAVVGVCDKRKGAVPVAFIETESLSDSDELIAFCRRRLPNYMIPKRFILLEGLPRIGSGKIDKKRLPMELCSG